MLTIERILDIDGRIADIIRPTWIIGAGLDNKIYVDITNPEATVPNLPPIDEFERGSHPRL